MNAIDIAVTGEVDSGKSTLIARFLCDSTALYRKAADHLRDDCARSGGTFELAYLLDSFEEERRDNFTLDTAQAYCQAMGQQFTFIDVPGHVELLKNMLCGVSTADAAVLVVDVRKAAQPQTMRHALILKFLGISHVVVCINKMDEVGFRKEQFEQAARGIGALFASLGLAAAAVIPVCAKEGDNIRNRSRRLSWYKGRSLSETLGRIRRYRGTNCFRFCVQDVYEVQGGTVCAGQVLSGSVRKGQPVCILPLNIPGNVVSIVALRPLREAVAPEAVGLMIAEKTARGDIICADNPPSCARKLRARVFCVRPLTRSGSLRLRCLTQDVAATIADIAEIRDAFSVNDERGEVIRENRVAIVDIECGAGVVFEKDNGKSGLGRFVLYDGNEICAAGIFC